MYYMNKRQKKSGLSMIEILIVTAVIGVLILAALSILPQQINKSRDGRRKSDLQKIKIAFENYFSDNDCYPDPDILNNCGGTDLQPYLASIPCDPQTKTRYLYAPEEVSCPHYYRVYANLEIDVDPVITELGCNLAGGCGAYAFFGEEIGSDAFDYNYGVSEGVPVANQEGSVPPGTQGYCCQVMGDQCNVWTQGDGVCNLGFYFTQPECNAGCGFSGEMN